MTKLSQTIDILRLLADPTRVRLLGLLADGELSVVEITQITQLPQSRVSTHLGKLREAGLFRVRHQGSSTFYSQERQNLPNATRKILDVLMENRSDPILASDQSRKEMVLHARETGTTWPESVAGQMDRHYSPGRTWEATALGLLKLLRLGEVLDAGSGDGSVASLLAPRCRSITCLDCSTKLLQAARKRIGANQRVSYALGDFHALPFTDASFDQVLLLHVLTYSQNPGQVIREAARVLRPGGDLLLLTLEQHHHDPITTAYGHVNRGFDAQSLRTLLRSAHLSIEHCEADQREKRPPHFAVLTALAHKPSAKLKQTKELT